MLSCLVSRLEDDPVLQGAAVSLPQDPPARFPGRWDRPREARGSHGTEVRLTPRPSEGDSCAVGRSAMPLTTRIESRNTRHASPSGLGRNRRNLFPSLSPWFVNLDSEPWPCSNPLFTDSLI